MMMPVKIHIVSQLSGENGAETIETISYGRLIEKNKKFYALYEETAITGLEGTKTTLKWDENIVVLLRTGTVNHRQEFARNFTAQSVYKTPYLTLNMETTTDYLYIYCQNNIWHIEIDYSLAIDGEHQSKVKMRLKIEEDIKREYQRNAGNSD